jgi:hypothetical protein
MSALHSDLESTDDEDTTPDRARGRPRPRRAVLGAGGAGLAAAVAGCTVQAGPRSDGLPQDRTLLDTTAEVEPGRHDSFRFAPAARSSSARRSACPG